VKRLRYVLMPGQSFTGSTLLGFLLNAHPSCVSVGAASGIVPGSDPESYRCSCGKLLADCEFWQEVSDAMAGRGYPFHPSSKPWPTAYRVSRRRVLNVLATRSLRSDTANDLRDAVVARLPRARARRDTITNYNIALARAVCEHEEVDTFIDSSRDPMRPRYLEGAPGLDVHGLHLVRDARGNVASILRHVPGISTDDAAKRWFRANTEARRVLSALPDGRRRTVRYEDLCADAQGTLDVICDGLGLPEAPLPSDFRDVDHHILGNDMRLGETGSVRLDERWRAVLTDADLGIIERRCGALNRELGYSWP